MVRSKLSFSEDHGIQEHDEMGDDVQNMIASSAALTSAAQPVHSSDLETSKSIKSKKEKLLNKIKSFDPDNGRLKRLAMFFSEEKLV